MHFYPRSPCGERRTSSAVTTYQPHTFLSTLSLRRATHVHNTDLRRNRNFYPRSPCGERQQLCCDAVHAHSMHFYPRSPCGERPACKPASEQSARDFYPRSPCGERRGDVGRTVVSSVDFYPRSPCGERRGVGQAVFGPRVKFLSTLSLRRATLASDYVSGSN